MISVVIPLYNKENCILDTLQSVLTQSYTNFEVLLVNDGSTDRSVERVQGISDSRIRLIHQQNAGPSAARNHGVNEAHYDWIVFLDADDILLPDSLASFAALTESHPEIAIFCSNFYFHVKGWPNLLYSYRYCDSLIKNNFRAWVYHRCMPRAGAAMFHRSLLLQYPYNECLRRYEDAEVLFRLMRTNRIWQIPKPTVVYNGDYMEASTTYLDISKDFLGHLSLYKKSFYEQIAIYQLYLAAVKTYPQQVRTLYPSWYRRYDLKLLCWIIDHIAYIAEKYSKKKYLRCYANAKN